MLEYRYIVLDIKTWPGHWHFSTSLGCCATAWDTRHFGDTLKSTVLKSGSIILTGNVGLHVACKIASAATPVSFKLTLAGLWSKFMQGMFDA